MSSFQYKSSYMIGILTKIMFILLEAFPFLTKMPIFMFQ